MTNHRVFTERWKFVLIREDNALVRKLPRRTKPNACFQRSDFIAPYYRPVAPVCNTGLGIHGLSAVNPIEAGSAAGGLQLQSRSRVLQLPPGPDRVSAIPPDEVRHPNAR